MPAVWDIGTEAAAAISLVRKFSSLFSKRHERAPCQIPPQIIQHKLNSARIIILYRLPSPARQVRSMAKSRILVVGATGDLGKYIAKASVKEGHPTFILVRPASAKKPVVTELESLGASTLYGELSDYGSLVAALKHVDVVISIVSPPAGQLKLIEAIKEVGHIKRFVPSEFGSELGRHDPNEEPRILESFAFGPKRVIRKAIQDAGIPYTYILNGAFASYFLAPLGQVDILLSGNVKPPRDKVTILGSGEETIVTTAEVDIGTLTVKAANDPRALNKKLVIRPKPNLISFNKVVEIWEKKIGHSLEKTFLSEAEVLKQIEGLSIPANFLLAIFLKVMCGEEIFTLNPTEEVTADELYPDYKYVTVDEYLDKFV